MTNLSIQRASLCALILSSTACLGPVEILDTGAEANTGGDDDPIGDGDGDGDSNGDGDGDGTGDGDGDDTGNGDGDGDLNPVLPDDFPVSLTGITACGDVSIDATTPDATVGLWLNGPTMAKDAHLLGMTQVREFELPNEELNLRLVFGSDLDMTCEDIDTPLVVDVEFVAVSGTVTMTVEALDEEPVPPEYFGVADVEISDVTFEREGLEPITIEEWSVAGVSVGWLPG